MRVYYSGEALWLMGAAGMCAGIPIGFCLPAAWGWAADRIAPRPLDTGLPTSSFGFARRRMDPAAMQRPRRQLQYPVIDPGMIPVDIDVTREARHVPKA